MGVQNRAEEEETKKYRAFARWLIDEGHWDPKHEWEEGKYPEYNNMLCTVARTGDVDFAKALIKRGADVNGPDNKESDKPRTPIMHAIMGNSAPMARLLIEKGADVEKADEAARADIMFGSHGLVGKAVMSNNLDMVKLLRSQPALALESGERKKKAPGQDPLLVAAGMGNVRNISPTLFAASSSCLSHALHGTHIWARGRA